MWTEKAIRNRQRRDCGLEVDGYEPDVQEGDEVYMEIVGRSSVRTGLFCVRGVVNCGDKNAVTLQAGVESLTVYLNHDGPGPQDEGVTEFRVVERRQPEEPEEPDPVPCLPYAELPAQDRRRCPGCGAMLTRIPCYVCEGGAR